VSEPINGSCAGPGQPTQDTLTGHPRSVNTAFTQTSTGYWRWAARPTCPLSIEVEFAEPRCRRVPAAQAEAVLSLKLFTASSTES
jgi:hypothetical protein